MKFRDLLAHALLVLALKIGTLDFAAWLVETVKTEEAKHG